MGLVCQESSVQSRGDDGRSLAVCFTPVRSSGRAQFDGINPFPTLGISPPHALLARDRPAAPQAAPVVAR